MGKCRLQRSGKKPSVLRKCTKLKVAGGEVMCLASRLHVFSQFPTMIICCISNQKRCFQNEIYQKLEQLSNVLLLPCYCFVCDFVAHLSSFYSILALPAH